ncbi:hypothetical protein GT037_010250 [Alternaria burnsii]|uniref:Uncharacterized protein n=1 Tax=Alternaria burnsii TaxID=1187904 RepID=A0A8H7AZ68_9PLEO|nr:uncharacterized protein GT037_010250 [Alternaria burnsii]KAF7671728.1 hypothetical protein GT037_010250 [Alternaria burnsii]
MADRVHLFANFKHSSDPVRQELATRALRYEPTDTERALEQTRDSQIAAKRDTAAGHLEMKKSSARLLAAAKLFQKFSEAKAKHARDLETALDEQKEQLVRSPAAELEEMKKYTQELDTYKKQAEAQYDQLEHACRFAQDTDDVIGTMERIIAKSKDVATKQGVLIQQLRQASP